MLLEPARLGLLKTLKTTLLMAKIIFPVTLLVVILERWAFLEMIALFSSPWLSIFGLPGEASLPILLGFFVNIYAAPGWLQLGSMAKKITITNSPGQKKAGGNKRRKRSLPLLNGYAHRGFTLPLSKIKPRWQARHYLT